MKKIWVLELVLNREEMEELGMKEWGWAWEEGECGGQGILVFIFLSHDPTLF